MKQNFRNTASFGKRQEFIAISELLKRGLDVYQTLVDDQQIDCVVRLNNKNKLKYFDVQIKARSRNAKKQSWGDWPSIKILNPRSNFIFIFYSEPLNKYWIIPSDKLAKFSYVAPKQKEKGLYKVNLSKYSLKKDKFVDNEVFVKYLNAFNIFK